MEYSINCEYFTVDVNKYYTENHDVKWQKGFVVASKPPPCPLEIGVQQKVFKKVVGGLKLIWSWENFMKKTSQQECINKTTLSYRLLWYEICQ